MNINDVKDDIKVPAEIWKEVFNHQMELAVKYKDIEDMGTLLETRPLNLDTKEGQKWIKDFAWRVTEELTEADEALYKAERSSSEHYDQYVQHYIEELVDALHFLTELSIIAGYDYKIVPPYPEAESEVVHVTSYHVIYNLGLMCNCLKNKPWKQTQMLTDRPKAETYLKMAWFNLLNLFCFRGLTIQDVYKFYFKKNAVNQFRIRSKY